MCTLEAISILRQLPHTADRMNKSRHHTLLLQEHWLLGINAQQHIMMLNLPHTMLPALALEHFMTLVTVP
jgi:hypothetical protein